LTLAANYNIRRASSQ